MATYDGFPVASYYFKVSIDGMELGFREVSGIKATVEYEEIDEGGNREESPRILKKMNFEKVSLKKGLVKGASMAIDVFEKFNLKFNIHNAGETLKYNDVIITLMSGDDKDLFSWILHEAYPLSWEVTGFDAMKNEISVETLELNYKRLEIVQH
jgi:phage tail-like protein